ncbi:Uncharacterised protein [Actinobacillus pleuropneumoniae]|nr:Uncharacterised protein [Actinobacillus pleuropneumoniae]
MQTPLPLACHLGRSQQFDAGVPDQLHRRSSFLGYGDFFALHRNISDLFQTLDGGCPGCRRSKTAILHRIPKRFILNGLTGAFHGLQQRAFRITLWRLGSLFLHFGFFALHRLVGSKVKGTVVPFLVLLFLVLFPLLGRLGFLLLRILRNQHLPSKRQKLLDSRLECFPLDLGEHRMLLVHGRRIKMRQKPDDDQIVNMLLFLAERARPL